MMSKMKSLSDSSTSESEDDYSKRFQQKSMSYVPWTATKRSLSTDDTEDEHQTDSVMTANKSASSFKSPNKYSERSFSTDDTEDEHLEMVPPAKKFKSDFKNPSQYVERDLSDSESDDKNSFVKTGEGIANMPSIETFNGSYGVGMKMMEKMGYKTGTGLGKFEQGRVNIVEASKQRGRRGLGLHIEGLEPSDVKWDSAKEEISLEEEIVWIPECDAEPLKISQMRNWMLEGPKKIDISSETEFCDPEILRDIISYKSVFDKLEPEEMRKARTRSNPFETIRGCIFLNRAAMKMANMDAAFDFMFSNPKDKNGRSLVVGNELLYFADICAGPGGFSEYILWRKKWECKGFGFTLKGPNDFKLEDFFAGPPETFEPHYGKKGNGDIYDPENLREFRKFVLENTDNRGVELVMADGGFSVEGQENEQEILSKRLYLCQFLCALSILREGGHFVCKLFDLFTPFSVGLVYLMYHAFEKICIFKPNTSRPANSERYLICKWRKENTKDICDYMFEVNCYFEKFWGLTSDKDIVEIVPLYLLKENKDFFNYIKESNNKIGTRQIIHLDKIRVFAQNTELHEERQNELRKQCLSLWKVPDKARSAPVRPEPDAKYKQIMQGENLSYLKNHPELLTESNLKKLQNVFDFHCVATADPKPKENATLFLGLGRSYIYQYDPQNFKWSKVEVTLELPADTLFYGELVSELRGEGRAQRKITCLHIIDAICLGGKDVRKQHYENRMLLAEKLAKAVSKLSRTDYTCLRVKKVWLLSEIDQIFENLTMKYTKNSVVPRLCYDLGDGRHILPTGLLIFKTTQDPWVTAYSKTNRKKYLFNTRENLSFFERQEAANANFQSCFSKRILWSWEKGVRLIPEQNTDVDISVVHGDILIKFVESQLRRMKGC